MISLSPPPLVPQCPVASCQAVGGLPQHVITAADPSRPWKQRPLGFAWQCWKCGTYYAKTVQGTYLLSWMGVPRGVPQAPRPVEGERLDELLADMRLGPTERGV